MDKQTNKPKPNLVIHLILPIIAATIAGIAIHYYARRDVQYAQRDAQHAQRDAQYAQRDAQYAIIELLASRFDSVDENMQFEQALSVIYEETEWLQTRVDVLENEVIDLENEVADFENETAYLESKIEDLEQQLEEARNQEGTTESDDEAMRNQEDATEPDNEEEMNEEQMSISILNYKVNDSGTYREFSNSGESFIMFGQEYSIGFTMRVAASFNIWGGGIQYVVFAVGNLSDKGNYLNLSIGNVEGNGDVYVRVFLDKTTDDGHDYEFFISSQVAPLYNERIYIRDRESMIIQVVNTGDNSLTVGFTDLMIID